MSTKCKVGGEENAFQTTKKRKGSTKNDVADVRKKQKAATQKTRKGH